MNTLVMSKKLRLLILGLSLCFFTGCAVNPVTGETQFNIFGPDPRNDIPLGRQWAPQIEKEFGGVVEDVGLQNYVDSAGPNHSQGHEDHKDTAQKAENRYPQPPRHDRVRGSEAFGGADE
ncbi:hypothetical protein ES703_110319 [subsurface metagenome]